MPTKMNCQSIKSPLVGGLGVFVQCILSGGTSVIKARALYAFVNQDYVFNERKLCHNEGINFRQLPKQTIVEEQSFALYPNPTINLFTVEISSLSNGVNDLVIYDAFGRNVKHLSIVLPKTNIDVSQLVPGIYYFRLKTNQSNLHNGKFSIVR